MTEKRHFIYIAAQEEASCIVKIGYSSNPMRRISELSGTGTPHPFHLLHAWEIFDNPIPTERLIHDALDYVRVNPSREFFDVSEAYPSLYNSTLPDAINCMHICNQLAEDIKVFLTKRGIRFARITYNALAEYYFETHGKIVY